jgi:hypothetical protein
MICGAVAGKLRKSSEASNGERKLNELWRNKTRRDFNEEKTFDFTRP